MADDWQVGDLALMIESGQLQCPHMRNVIHMGSLCPSPGAVRKVVCVEESRVVNSFSRSLYCGCIDLDFADGTGGVSQRFRKIRPHQPDAEDAETIRLLTGAPVREPTPC